MHNFGQLTLIKTNPNTQIKCVECSELVTLPLTLEEIETGVKDISRSIQDIFPTLTDGQREMLKTGICDTCWSKLFKRE